MLDKNGQNLSEYVLIVAVVIAAVVGMQTYVKRGLQAEHKDAVEYAITSLRNATDATSEELPLQYEPDYLKSTHTITRNSNIRTGLKGGDATKNVIIDNTQRTGISEILPVDLGIEYDVAHNVEVPIYP